VKNSRYEVWECIKYFPSRTYTKSKCCKVWEKDKSLLIHWFFRYKVRNLKKVHCTSPEYNKPCVCYVSTKKLTRKVNKTSVSRPPSESSRFLVSTTHYKC